MMLFSKHCGILAAGLALGLTVTSCHRRSADVKKQKPPEEHPAAAPSLSDDEPGYAQQVTKQILALTSGARTRIVWCQSQNPRDPDTFSTSQRQLLKGLDTKDGLGIRDILKDEGNYTRPLISTDGNTILFSRRHLVRQNKLWQQDADIYRTDWKGSAPVRIANGLATACWLDPKTGVEWVYAAQDWKPNRKQETDPNRLVRFPLDHPEKMEPLYDETRLDYDNIQLSRDGLRASGGFPWPNAGLFLFEGKSVTTHKLANGCWPACAPDDSRVSWVFNGDHRSATLFSDDGEKSWTVDFTLPEARGREMFHPRWTNHPRFLVITGPYRGKRGNTVLNGGKSAEICLGRFSPSLDKIEAWGQVTNNNVGDNFPDAWIDGGDKAQLTGFAASTKSSATPIPPPTAWVPSTDGLMVLWRDHVAQNTWHGADGHAHQTRLDRLGAARIGRVLELLSDGGSTVLAETSAEEVLPKLRDSSDATFEALVLPPSFEIRPASPAAFLLRSPGFDVEARDGTLLVKLASGASFKSATPLPAQPFHLAMTLHSGSASALINGKEFNLHPDAAKDASLAATETISFGEGWNGGLRNIALYNRVLDASQISRDSAAALAQAAKFPAPPAQIKLRGKLVETTTPPTPESIVPYTSSLVACVYEIEQVLSGDFKEKRILVNHWGLLNRERVAGFPREVGKTYELTVEKQSDHPEVNGERVTDETTAFDMQPWLDVSLPKMEP